MSVVDWIFIALASAALVLSIQNWRGAVWLAMISASYFTSGAYWRLTGDGAMFALLCDAAVFLCMYAVGRYLWEICLMAVVLCMAMVNVLHGALDIETYQISLEMLNLAALLTIGGIGSFKLAGQTDGFAFHHVRHFLGFGFAVRGQDS